MDKKRLLQNVRARHALALGVALAWFGATSAFAADPSGPTRPLVRFAFPKSDEVLEEGIARLARWRAASA